MKRKLTKKYVEVLVCSSFLIILLWVILSYLFVFSGKTVHNNSPQYLVNSFERYIDKKNLIIKEDGRRLLKENNLWAQVINIHGEVVDECNAPDVALQQYNIFEIIYYSMNSDTLENQTIFISRFERNKNYGVIIGCASSTISKHTIKLSGGTWNAVKKSVIILGVVFLVVGIGAGILFSHTISSPVQGVIEYINDLEVGKSIETQKGKKNLFTSVYESLYKLQLRLKIADKEREYAEQQRKEWIDNISHDMKTPLSSIKGYAEIMTDEEYEISKDEMRSYSKIIMNNAGHIKSLIEELKFGRLLETGELKLQKEEVNVCALLKESCEELPAVYKADNLSFVFGDSAIYAMLDRHLIKRCFLNIICNAIVHNYKDVSIQITCKKEGNSIFISIKDDGYGMDEEERKKVFERYYRGESSEKISGSGLGLAIAKKIVEAHNGVIRVESQKGKGSTFQIVL